MAKTTSSGKPGVNRRGFLYAAGATAIGVAGWEAGRRADAAGGARADATAVAHHHHATVDPGAFRYPAGRPGLRPVGGQAAAERAQERGQDVAPGDQAVLPGV